MQQKMAELPSERVNISPPFTYTEWMYLVPFILKKAEKSLRDEGIIFTCLSPEQSI